MIVKQSLELFAAILDGIPALLPAQALAVDGAPMAQDGPFLDPAAHPPEADNAAIVAVIDHAIPFAHPLFTTAEGHSRVASVWLMEAARADRRADIAFGRELRGPQIDALRRAGDPHAAYRACGLMQPGGVFDLAHAASHGAAVAALAAGHDPRRGRGRDFPMLAVSLPRSVLAETTGSLSGLFIQAAVVFIIARARALAREMNKLARCPVKPPLVVNLSLGVTAGADDGSALLSRLQDAITKIEKWELGPIFFVLPTGNSRQARLRAKLKQGGSIGWRIPPADPTLNAVEIWGAAGEPAPRLALSTPDGRQIAVPLDETGQGVVEDGRGARLARVVLQRRGADAGRACLTVIVPPTLPGAGKAAAPPGLWKLHLTDAGASGCDLFIHRDDRLSGFRGQGLQSSFVHADHAPRTASGRWPERDSPPLGPIRRNGTASLHARGAQQIRVGATLAWPPGRLSAYTGLLSNGDGGDITAPADASSNVFGMTLPGIAPAARQRLSGTSLSAPQATRWLAEALAGGADARSRADVVNLLAAATPPPDLGLPDLPWRCGFPRDPARTDVTRR